MALVCKKTVAKDLAFLFHVLHEFNFTEKSRIACPFIFKRKRKTQNDDKIIGEAIAPQPPCSAVPVVLIGWSWCDASTVIKSPIKYLYFPFSKH